MKEVVIVPKNFMDITEEEISFILEKTYQVEFESIVERDIEAERIYVNVISYNWETNEEKNLEFEDEVILTPTEIIYPEVFDSNIDKNNLIYKKYLLAKGYNNLLLNNEFLDFAKK